MLKGKTTIELTDINTGEVTIIEDENFVTNAISDLCQPILRNHNAFHNVYSVYTNRLSLNELLGGVLLFDTPLEENPDKYFPPITSNMTGHASEITYSGSDLSMGSFNNTLSELTATNSRKFVWDFTAEQANGTISSVCLTTRHGGLIGHGTTTLCEKSLTYEKIFGCLQKARISAYYDANRSYFVPVYLSFENDYVLFMSVSGFSSGKITFVKFPIWTNKEDIFTSCINVSSTISDLTNMIGKGYTEYSSQVVDLTSVIGTSGYIAGAQDGKYLYLARNSSNNYNWAPNTQLTLVKLNLEDFTYETFKVTNTTGENCNIFQHYDYNLFSDGYSFSVCNGYMFVPARASLGRLYAINLEDNTIVHAVKTADGTEELLTNNSSYNRCFGMTVNNNVILAPTRHQGIYVSSSSGPYDSVRCVNTNDFIMKSLNVPFWGMGRTALSETHERNFPTDNPLYFGISDVEYISSSANYCVIYIAFVPNVLMTINNLETPVTKTPSQTMRITYTITKEE